MGEQKAHEHAAIHGASFKGMRHDLARWLDEVGMHEVASLDSCSELFGPKGEEVLHTTSAIRYPTFKHEHGGSWTNYSGSSPNLLDHRLLRSMVEKILAVELRQLDRAIVVPVGRRPIAPSSTCAVSASLTRPAACSACRIPRARAPIESATSRPPREVCDARCKTCRSSREYGRQVLHFPEGEA